MPVPKRSLDKGNGGQQNKFEQLNQAVEKMLARNDGRLTKAGAEIEPLVRIAADLRNLPSANFQGTIEIRIRRQEAYVYRCRARSSRAYDCCTKNCVPRSCQSD